MRIPSRSRRRGFTLLEVVLAIAIGVLLLGALYVAVDMQLNYAQLARDRVETSTVARSVLARIDNDVSLTVGLSDPARHRRPVVNSSAGAGASNSSTGAAGTSTGAATTPAASSSTTSASSSGSSSSSSSSSSTAGSVDGLNTPVTLPLGVVGEADVLHLYVSRYPREAVYPLNPEAPPVVSDLRRMSYWLAGGADNPLGLARQEVPIATSDDALDNLPPGLDDEAPFVIAGEVRSLQFQYFDGTDLVDSWDSTQLGADGVTPIGSPRAIVVTIGVVPAGKVRPGDPPPALQMHSHTIAIATANGTTQVQQQNPPPSTTGGGASP